MHEQQYPSKTMMEGSESTSLLNSRYYYQDNNNNNSTSTSQQIMEETNNESGIDQQKEIQQQIKKEDDAHLSSNISSLINIIKANIGSGILGMPFAFRCSGYWLGLFSIGIIMFICVHCTLLLIDSKKEINKERQKRGESKIITFQELGGAAFGKIATVIIIILLIFTQLGFCCAYMTFISSNLMALLDIPTSVLYKFLFILLTGICAYPFCLIRNLKNLSIFSIISELTLITGCLIVVYYDIVKIVSEPFPGLTRNLQAYDFERFGTFFGICLFAFEGVGLVLPIENNMKNKKAYPSLLYIGMIIICVSMASFGLIGYLSYGMGVNSLITFNIPKEGVLPLIVKICLMIALLLTYPIQLYPISQMIDQALTTLSIRFKKRIEIEDERTEFLNYHNNENSVNGEQRKEESSSLFDSILNLLKSPLFHLENVSRLLLILATASLSAFIPSFGDFLGLIGGFGGTSMALLLPCAVHLKVFWKKTSWAVIVKDIVLFVFALFATGFSTYISVRDLITHLTEGSG
ncbi:hypothetical protein ABK040_007532 [Willaertia magna]